MNKNRRSFLKTGAGAASALVAPAIVSAQNPPSNRLRVSVMGLGRGIGHIRGLAKVPNVEIVSVCDVDSTRQMKAAKVAEELTGKKPRRYTDFRKILEDKSVDALTIAAPNHWHTLATVLACQAGKDVYVEKPGSYCPREAQLIVERARQAKKQVQLGTQRRSYPKLIEAIGRLKEGVIGELRASRCWYSNKRASIGKGVEKTPPATLDYELWQGPATGRPYKSNLIHYNWHWHWHWGNGELGNNGVHALDVARWGMGVGLPTRISCRGGRYHHDDDQETPDTAVAYFDYGNIGITWDGSSCHPRKEEELPFVKFYGEGGTMEIDVGNSYRIYDPEGKEIDNQSEAASDVPHFQNFADRIREGTRLNAPIGDAQKAAMMCHLGNIAYRTNTVVEIEKPRFPAPANNAVETLWKREYRKGWAIES